MAIRRIIQLGKKFFEFIKAGYRGLGRSIVLWAVDLHSTIFIGFMVSCLSDKLREALQRRGKLGTLAWIVEATNWSVRVHIIGGPTTMSKWGCIRSSSSDFACGPFLRNGADSVAEMRKIKLQTPEQICILKSDFGYCFQVGFPLGFGWGIW